MTTFVLIHGAWHGRWCWDHVVPLLEVAGHRVLAPDLKGMGNHDASIGEVTLATWTDQIADLILAQNEPIVLVGHSRGGLVVSQVAERIPERLHLLVYVCAFLLRDGQTLHEVAQAADNFQALSAATVLHDDGTSSVTEDGIGELFYNRTPAERVKAAQKRMGREPLSSFVTPVHVTQTRFGSVPRAYIECSHDQAIPLVLQRSMQAALPCETTIRLESDHSPFFSMPDMLVEALEKVRLSIGVP